MIMLFALDKNGSRVYIENAHVKHEYFCPICGEQMVLKKGQIPIHHFAHPLHSKCTDSWNYEKMSEWHMNWQGRCPLDTQEIVKVKDGQKHRADVLLEDRKVVFEFQHSPLSCEEFDDRNSFYNSLGYKVIWIFDLSEQFENGMIENHISNVFLWSRPKSTFNNFNPKENNDVEVYFQIQVAADNNETVAHIKATIEAGYEIHSEESKVYFEEQKNDKIQLIKITQASKDGFKRFETDRFLYGEKDIVQRFCSSNDTKENTVKELRDSKLRNHS